MNLERIEDDGGYMEIRFKTIMNEKPQFIHISMEAWEDILGGALNDNNKADIIMAVKGKLSSNQFVERLDGVGVPYQAVLLTTKDLA